MNNRKLIFSLTLVSSFLLMCIMDTSAMGTDSPGVIINTVEGSSIEGEWCLSSYRYFYDGNEINLSDSVVGIWRSESNLYYYHTQGSFNFGSDGKGMITGVGENHKDVFQFIYSETEKGISVSVNGRNLVFTNEGGKLVNRTMISGIYGWSARPSKPSDTPIPQGVDGKSDHRIVKAYIEYLRELKKKNK